MGLRTALLALSISPSLADIYLHNFRGSNNRLNERSANRNNGNRLFDSQNNNRGGYNVGDLSNSAFDTSNPCGANDPTCEHVFQAYDQGADVSDRQYPMAFAEGSWKHLEWTAQHGCGGNEASQPHKDNCNMLLQYMCDMDDPLDDLAMTVRLRDGGNTNTPDKPSANTGRTGILDTEQTNIANNRGHQEHEAFYYECETVDRNKGLFTADQNLRGHTAKYTRQNPNGNRRGLECPEERDYWPYWRPSPWRDIVNMNDEPWVWNTTTADGKFVKFDRPTKVQCEAHAGESQNVQKKWKCFDSDFQADVMRHTNEAECTAAGGQWRGYSHDIPAPQCTDHPWSRVNHLGNVASTGEMASYDWKIPSMAQLQQSGVKVYSETMTDALGQSFTQKFAKCAFRVRYNISTDDYDPWLTDAASNEDWSKGVIPPVQENPTVDVGAFYQGLKLAINTAQFGRTFQDRSHIFSIFETKNNAPFNNADVVNVNVRGKRGNIVQAFPAIEYSFVPDHVSAAPGQWFHFQWTGSNTHNNGHPAGDGQAGDAGEGTGGTDRHGILQMANQEDSYPVPQDVLTTQGLDGVDPLFTDDNIECFIPLSGNKLSTKDCALALSSAGYYWRVEQLSSKPAMNPLLNNAPASFQQGIVARIRKPGTYHFMSSRNNNFSNRSQKMKITVE